MQRVDPAFPPAPAVVAVILVHHRTSCWVTPSRNVERGRRGVFPQKGTPVELVESLSVHARSSVVSLLALSAFTKDRLTVASRTESLRSPGRQYLPASRPRRSPPWIRPNSSACVCSSSSPSSSDLTNIAILLDPVSLACRSGKAPYYRALARLGLCLGALQRPCQPGRGELHTVSHCPAMQYDTSAVGGLAGPSGCRCSAAAKCGS
jgi:hypothetical protein